MTKCSGYIALGIIGAIAALFGAVVVSARISDIWILGILPLAVGTAMLLYARYLTHTAPIKKPARWVVARLMVVIGLLMVLGSAILGFAAVGATQAPWIPFGILAAGVTLVLFSEEVDRTAHPMFWGGEVGGMLDRFCATLLSGAR